MDKNTLLTIFIIYILVLFIYIKSPDPIFIAQMN
jgi:hypothetical protein